MSIIEQPKLPEIAENSVRVTRPSIGLFDAILQGKGFCEGKRFANANALIVGLVIGAGIFETPALVAANVDNALSMLQVWGFGGLISIIGALCYAELATAYPHIGGSYDYLKRAFGRSIAILFAWARLSVIQTGSIALLAFVFGDYASQLLPLGSFSAGIYAALSIVLLTLLNVMGLKHSKRLQNWLTITTVLGLLAVIIIGLTLPAAPVATAAAPTASPDPKSLMLQSKSAINTC